MAGRAPGGLSSRLLLLTILFVALAGLMILPPSLAQYEDSWLYDRLRAAELMRLRRTLMKTAKMIRTRGSPPTASSLMAPDLTRNRRAVSERGPLIRKTR